MADRSALTASKKLYLPTGTVTVQQSLPMTAPAVREASDFDHEGHLSHNQGSQIYLPPKNGPANDLVRGVKDLGGRIRASRATSQVQSGTISQPARDASLLSVDRSAASRRTYTKKIAPATNAREYSTRAGSVGRRDVNRASVGLDPIVSSHLVAEDISSTDIMTARAGFDWLFLEGNGVAGTVGDFTYRAFSIAEDTIMVNQDAPVAMEDATTADLGYHLVIKDGDSSMVNFAILLDSDPVLVGLQVLRVGNALAILGYGGELLGSFPYYSSGGVEVRSVFLTNHDRAVMYVNGVMFEAALSGVNLPAAFSADSLFALSCDENETASWFEIALFLTNDYTETRFYQDHLYLVDKYRSVL